jgi:hypothetical protein
MHHCGDDPMYHGLPQPGFDKVRTYQNGKKGLFHFTYAKSFYEKSATQYHIDLFDPEIQ